MATGFFAEEFARDCAHWKTLRWQLIAYLPLFLIAGSLVKAVQFGYTTHYWGYTFLWLNAIGGAMLTIGVITYYWLGIEKYRQTLAVVTAEMWVIIMWLMGVLISTMSSDVFELAMLFLYAGVGLVTMLLLSTTPKVNSK